VIIIETLAHNIAKKIAVQLDYDDEKKAVIAYGLIAILQMAMIFILISTIGIIFDFWFECMIIYLSVGFIRKSTGGAHSKTMNGCIIISVLSITLLSALSRFLLDIPLHTNVNLGITFVIFLISFIVFYIRVPVDSPNKPIVKAEKIKRLRKQSFFILTIFFILSIIFIMVSTHIARFYSIAFSIRLAMLWQVLTLTKTGIAILEKVDSKINTIFNKDRLAL
jgi:accessory gene regulator B